MAFRKARPRPDWAARLELDRLTGRTTHGRLMALVSVIAAVAREKNLFVMEAMWTRFFPLMFRLRELLEAGVIGTCAEVARERHSETAFGVEAGCNHSRSRHGVAVARAERVLNESRKAVAVSVTVVPFGKVFVHGPALTPETGVEGGGVGIVGTGRAGVGSGGVGGIREGCGGQ